jgi:hypothetical protein
MGHNLPGELEAEVTGRLAALAGQAGGNLVAAA